MSPLSCRENWTCRSFKFASTVSTNSVLSLDSWFKRQQIYFLKVVFHYCKSIFYNIPYVRTYHLMPLTLFYIDAMLDVPVVSPFNAVSNYLQMKIFNSTLRYSHSYVGHYTIKKTFFYFCTCSVAYEKSSIKAIHPLYLLQPQILLLRLK